MKHDPVNHPSHYTSGKWEVIEFIEDKNLSFSLGNAIKYICRAGKKDPHKYKEDLEKAEWYLKRAIFNQDTISAGSIKPLEFANDQNLEGNLYEFFVAFKMAIGHVSGLELCLEFLNKEIDLLKE